MRFIVQFDGIINNNFIKYCIDFANTSTSNKILFNLMNLSKILYEIILGKIGFVSSCRKISVF